MKFILKLNDNKTFNIFEDIAGFKQTQFSLLGLKFTTQFSLLGLKFRSLTSQYLLVALRPCYIVAAHKYFVNQ